MTNESKSPRSNPMDAPAQPDTTHHAGPAHDGSRATQKPADRLRDATPSRDREPETQVWSGRSSWKHYSLRLLLWAAANLFMAVILGMIASGIDSMTGSHVFWTVAVLFVASGVWVIGGIFLRILGCSYRLTTERLFIERGILSRTIDQTELIRVDDVRIHKSLVDRLFGLGTVTVKSTDATDRDLSVEGISEPEKVAEAIRTRMRTLRRQSLFVESL